MRATFSIAWFGPSLAAVESGAYVRGIMRALHKRGHRVTYYEISEKQATLPNPEWPAKVRISPAQIDWALDDARHADLIIRSSGMDAADAALNEAVLALRTGQRLVLFWDLDAGATLFKAAESLVNPFRVLIPQYDLILSYGGGEAVTKAYLALGAQDCIAIDGALDTGIHRPTAPQPRFAASMAYLGHRTPERDTVFERYFAQTAARTPEHRFTLAGNGWHTALLSHNVRNFGSISASEQAAFTASATTLLNIDRGSTSRFCSGSPLRIYEAAGVGGCVISMPFRGIEDILEPGSEILVAYDTEDVIGFVRSLTPDAARRIGQAARDRILAHHTYAHRVALLEQALGVRPHELAFVG